MKSLILSFCSFSALMQLVGQQKEHSPCQKSCCNNYE